MFDREELKEIFAKGTHQITFLKADGSRREMVVTLDPEIIPEECLPKGTCARKENKEVLPVFSVEDGAWRSFRLDRLREVNCKAV